jgi:hypothetical protein
MSKFVAQSLADLRTPERSAGRILRNVDYIVAVEVDDGSWCELDAETEEHARVLARNWVDKLGARGCSCWHVRRQDGKLVKQSFFNYYWSPQEAYHEDETFHFGEARQLRACD